MPKFTEIEITDEGIRIYVCPEHYGFISKKELKRIKKALDPLLKLDFRLYLSENQGKLSLQVWSPYASMVEMLNIEIKKEEIFNPDFGEIFKKWLKFILQNS